MYESTQKSFTEAWHVCMHAFVRVCVSVCERHNPAVFSMALICTVAASPSLSQTHILSHSVSLCLYNYFCLFHHLGILSKAYKGEKSQKYLSNYLYNNETIPVPEQSM